MNNNTVVLPYKIKRKYPYIAAYTIIAFIMLALALICLFSPFISVFDAFTPTMSRVYMIIGGVCTPFFAFIICYSILNIVSPTIGFTVTEKGFTDSTMANGGVGFIPAEAIISLKIFGDKKKKSKQFLGIRLDTSVSATFGKTKKARQEILSNIESGMPAIIIRQCDLKTTVRDLLNVMLEVYGQGETKTTETNKTLESEAVDVLCVQGDENNVLLTEENTSAFVTDEVLEILPADDGEEVLYDSDLAINDVPLTMDFESEKPRITSIDDLLSQLLNKKDTNKPDNEE